MSHVIFHGILPLLIGLLLPIIKKRKYLMIVPFLLAAYWILFETMERIYPSPYSAIKITWVDYYADYRYPSILLISSIIVTYFELKKNRPNKTAERNAE